MGLAPLAILSVLVWLSAPPVHVYGTSMAPTLHDGDFVIANTLEYHFHRVEQGDVIILRDPFDSSKELVKRVIAGPGDRLHILDGQVHLNGRVLTEPYLKRDAAWTIRNRWPADEPANDVQVPPDSYFVMGDNRNVSSDSRLFGWVRSDQIEARARFRVLPPSDWGPV